MLKKTLYREISDNLLHQSINGLAKKRLRAKKKKSLQSELTRLVQELKKQN